MYCLLFRPQIQYHLGQSRPQQLLFRLGLSQREWLSLLGDPLRYIHYGFLDHFRLASPALE
jgi:hypothetical protein